MDFASRGLCWGESICQKLDNVIQDNLIVQDPAMFINALGDHVRKIYVEVADDWLNPFSDNSDECANPDLVKDVKDIVPQSVKDLDEKLTEENKINYGLETTESPGHHAPVPLNCLPLKSSLEEATSEVCRIVISSPSETHGRDSSNVTGQATSLPSSLDIQYARLTEVSDEVPKSSIFPPAEQTQHELSTMTGHDNTLCSSVNTPQDPSAEEESTEDCDDSVISLVKPTQNELAEICDEVNTEKIVSCADGTEAIAIEEFEDIELKDGWDDSVLNEILLISQHSSKNVSGKKKPGRLAAIASRFRSEKKKNDNQIMTWIYGNYTDWERIKDIERKSVSRKDLNHNKSSESLDTCVSDWELV